MSDISSFPQLISKWPTLTALAEEMGVPYQTAAAWKLRESIPAERWPELIAVAKARGVELSLETLHSWSPPKARAQ